VWGIPLFNPKKRGFKGLFRFRFPGLAWYSEQAQCFQG